MKYRNSLLPLLTLKEWFPAIMVALLYYGTGKLSFYYTIDSMIVTISVFFPEGFALAFVLLFGRRVIVGIFLGQFVLAISQNFPFFPSILIALSNSMEAWLAYVVFQKLGIDRRLSTIYDIYLLIAVIVFILQPFSAFLGTTILYVFGIIGEGKWWMVFFSWWFGNVMGQLLLTPLLLYLFYAFKEIDMLKLLGISGVLGVVCYTFIYIVPISNSSVLFSITIVPLVLLLSFRNGIVYALFSIVVITLIAIYTANHGIGPFSLYDPRTNLINLNFYILAHILIVLIIGVLFIEKNRALQRLFILNQALEDRVKSEVEKNRQKDRLMFLQERLAKMGEVVSLIIHQWKQPLNNLSLLNQGLYLRYQRKKIDEKVIERFFQDSKNQIAQMVKVTHDYKEFFTPDRQKERFCLNESITYALDLLKPVLEHERIMLIYENDHKVYLEGYPNEFGQVIVNIVNNAKDILQQQELVDKRIVIALKEDAESIFLTIHDNGGGISQRDKDKIFDLYFSTKKEKEGMGLGLYMAKIIVEEYMGGTISVRNEQGGALFEIVFSKKKR